MEIKQIVHPSSSGLGIVSGMERHERLQYARERKGFATPTEAARAHGWNQATYLGNENGSTPFSDKRAREYADKLDVSFRWLTDGTGDPDDHKHEAKYRRLRPVDREWIDEAIDARLRQYDSEHSENK